MPTVLRIGSGPPNSASSPESKPNTRMVGQRRAPREPHVRQYLRRAGRPAGHKRPWTSRRGPRFPADTPSATPPPAMQMHRTWPPAGASVGSWTSIWKAATIGVILQGRSRSCSGWCRPKKVTLGSTKLGLASPSSSQFGPNLGRSGATSASGWLSATGAPDLPLNLGWLR